MSVPPPAASKRTRQRITLLIVALCVAIAGAVYLADRFSIRDRNIQPPASEPASTTSAPASQPQ
jgi:hypothetical protein